MKNYILSLWNKLSDKNKERVISLFNTFGSTFILTVATLLLATGSPEWTVAFWGGLLTAGVREAFKAVVATYVPVRLGGRKS